MSTTPLVILRSGNPVREHGATFCDARGLRLAPAVVLASALSLAGLFAIHSTCSVLWSMWHDDALKSIGGLVPLVSALLILRVWRTLGWTLEGSWWGLAILAATIGLVHLREVAVMELVLSPSWSIFLPPYSAVAVAYAAGVVLLFGGTRLLRAALFPVGLMAVVNPVPHVFSRFIDLPLQYAAASLARGFAHALGQPLTPDQLRLMFTPQFGMFIAPGCNGIRGAVTMGLIALVAGYLYCFRLRSWVLITIAAVLLGYLFNFARLTMLVLYYLVALRLPWMRSHAQLADYILGAALFFSATVLLFAAIRRWSPQRDLRIPPLSQIASDPVAAPRTSFAQRAAVFAMLIAAASASYARALVQSPQPERAMARAVIFPAHVGGFTMRREWNESLADGRVVFHWAEYVAPHGGPVVSLGVSPMLGAHDTLLCHTARGEDWLWHGNLRFATAAAPTDFSGSLFNNGATQYLEAATVCTGAACGQTATSGRELGLVFSRPDAHALLDGGPAHPLPILLRAETPDAALPLADARAELTETLKHFLAGADLAAFTAPYRQQQRR